MQLSSGCTRREYTQRLSRMYIKSMALVADQSALQHAIGRNVSLTLHIAERTRTTNSMQAKLSILQISKAHTRRRPQQNLVKKYASAKINSGKVFWLRSYLLLHDHAHKGCSGMGESCGFPATREDKQLMDAMLSGDRCPNEFTTADDHIPHAETAQCALGHACMTHRDAWSER